MKRLLAVLAMVAIAVPFLSSCTDESFSDIAESVQSSELSVDDEEKMKERPGSN